MTDVRQSNAGAPSWLCWAACGHARSAGDVSGDSFVVHGDDDAFLVAVVDGLGHGQSALDAARATEPSFQRQDALRAPLEQLMKDAHEAARNTRGAVVTVVRVRRNPLAVESVAVGNVDGIVKSGRAARERIYLSGGVVGFRIPPLRTFSAQLEAPLVVALATDGVDSRFTSDPLLDGPYDVEPTAALLLERHSAHNDDALVFLARVAARPA